MGGGLRQAWINVTQFNIHFVFISPHVQIFEEQRGEKPTATHMNQ